MQVSTGDVFPSLNDARSQGVPEDDLVEVRGTRKALKALRSSVRLAARVRFRRAKVRQKMQKASRRANWR